MKYRIIEEKENPKDSVIEKTGHVITFTLKEVEDHQKQLQVARTEIVAKEKLEAAKMTNIEQNHPFILEMSDQDKFTCHLHYEAALARKQAELKLEQIDALLKDYGIELIDIQAQVGVAIPKESLDESK